MKENTDKEKKVNTDKEKIDELMTRGISEIIVEESLRERLISGKQLRIKFGVDATGSELHIGHAVPLRKLRQFQELGHQVILLIGDFTAKIGDPSGRNETRPPLTDEQIRDNMRSYVTQAGRVLNMKNVEVRYNSEWYAGKDAVFLMELTSLVTVARILERDDFQKRLKEDADIQTQEMLYPLLQGYDSVELKADVEIGGTDQKFNCLMGRKLQKRYKQQEQDVITVPLLEGTDGQKKMSKSYGNYIALTDTPEDMYGKTMSIPDTLIIKYFELATDISLSEVAKYEKLLKKGENPRNIKMALAYELTRLYHGEDGAKLGEKHFCDIIQNKEIPDEIPEFKPSAYDIVSVLVEAGFCKSNSEARREIDGGGVKINDIKVDNYDAQTKSSDVVKKGKRFFVRVV